MAKKNKDVFDNKIESQRQKEKGYLYSLTRIYVVFVLSVYPLYVGTEGYNDIVKQKAYFYWAVSVIFFIAFTLFFLVYKFGSGRNEFDKPLWKRLGMPDYAAAAFLLIITLSCIFSEYQDKVWLGTENRNDGWITYACMIVSFFIISRWYKPNKHDFSIFGISSLLLCIYGFIQFYGYDFLNLFPYNQLNMVDGKGNPLHSGFSIEYRTTIGNINFVGIYVCICVILFGILYIRTKSKIRFFYGTISIMNFVLRIIACSDSAIVGITATIILLIPYWISEKKTFGKSFILLSSYGLAYFAHHKFVMNIILPGINESSPLRDYSYFKNNYSTLPLNPILILSILGLILGFSLVYVKIPWPKMKTAQIAGILLVGVMIIGGLGGIEILGKRFSSGNIIYEAREIMHGNFEDGLGSGRVFIWKRAVARVQDLPLLGTGSDTFIEAFGTLNQKESVAFRGAYYDKAHNDFIQILLCNGILGLTAYIFLILGTIALSIKKAFDDTLIFASLGAVLAYLGQSFFGIDTVIVTPIFWLLLAVLRGQQIGSVEGRTD